MSGEITNCEEAWEPDAQRVVVSRRCRAGDSGRRSCSCLRGLAPERVGAHHAGGPAGAVCFVRGGSVSSLVLSEVFSGRRALPSDDDEVDALCNQVYRELLALMMADPSTFDQATLLLWAAHNLERAADRFTNSCQRTVFAVTGELLEMDAE